MTYCTHFEDVEDLALGTLAPARRSSVEAHVAQCQSCRAELVVLRAERELFVQRAEVAPAPPAWLAASIAACTVEKVEKNETLRVRIGRMVHGTPAYAAALAALFVLVFVARFGGVSSLAATTESSHDRDPPSSVSALGSLQANGDEPLACFVVPASLGRSNACTMRFAPAPVETLSEVVASGGKSEAASMCEPGVTSSMSRQ